MIFRAIAIILFTISIGFAQENETSPSAEEQLKAFTALRTATREATTPQSITDINKDLRPHDIIYMPEGEGPFPVMLFFHGCSGRTLSHEQDWANRLMSENIAMISIDSYSGRGVNWEDACNFKAMIPWQRAADVIATIEYVKTLDKVDGNSIYLTGFSHGAMTLWAAQVFASEKQAPIGMKNWLQSGFDGVKGNFLFYGPCMEPWTADVTTHVFTGDNDAYIDEQLCVDYENIHPKDTGSFNLTIYPGATHTFDHAKPNAANVEAGSVYDEAATMDAWQQIKNVIMMR